MRWLRAVLRRRSLVPLLASLLLPALSCGKSGSEPSSLSKRAGAAVEAPAPAPADGKVERGGKADGEADGSVQDKLQLDDAPPTDAPRVTLRLKLDDPTTYEMTTLGMVKFTMVQSPVGFARRERVTLDECAGEGASRQCTATHRYTNFESELPILADDEARVSNLITTHRLAATGARTGTTTVEGPKEQRDGDAGRALSDVHRFYCLRFPEEPVAVGAKWKDTCRTRTGGTVVTREVMWELSNVDEDPTGLGTRAELTVVGKVSKPDAKGETREGTLQGRLLFWVDRGHPYKYQERLVIKTDDAGRMESTTDIATQFSLVLPGKPEKVVLTSGQTLEEAQATATAATGTPEAGSPAQPGATSPPTPSLD